jgi:hypothetical protein
MEAPAAKRSLVDTLASVRQARSALAAKLMLTNACPCRAITVATVLSQVSAHPLSLWTVFVALYRWHHAQATASRGKVLVLIDMFAIVLLVFSGGIVPLT